MAVRSRWLHLDPSAGWLRAAACVRAALTCTCLRVCPCVPVPRLRCADCDEACYTEACGWDAADCEESDLAGDLAGCADRCRSEYIDDGECDLACNVAACIFDGADCSHGHGECYEHPSGEDYRGAVNVTATGRWCQRWSAQFPNQHFFTHVRYPSAGLGAHTSCRNPGGLHHRPWCFTTDSRVRWEECAVPGASEAGSCSERLHHHLVPPAKPRASSTCERHCPHAFALLLSDECDAAVECAAEDDRDRASAPEALEWSDGLIASA